MYEYTSLYMNEEQGTGIHLHLLSSQGVFNACLVEIFLNFTILHDEQY